MTGTCDRINLTVIVSNLSTQITHFTEGLSNARFSSLHPGETNAVQCVAGEFLLAHHCVAPFLRPGGLGDATIIAGRTLSGLRR